jgi:hypothetical protein
MYSILLSLNASRVTSFPALPPQTFISAEAISEKKSNRQGPNQETIDQKNEMWINK